MTAVKVEIDVYSHGFSVDYHSRASKDAVRELVYMMAQWGWIKKPPRWKLERVVVRTYTGRTKDGRRWFSIFLLQDLLKLLARRGVSKDEILIHDHPLPKPARVEFPRNDKKPPRDYQEPIIDFFLKADPIEIAGSHGGRLAVTNLQTGKGKTLVALETMTRLGVRTIIQMKGGYIHRWIDDLEDLFDFVADDILVIRGSASMKAIMSMALNGELKAKVILLSTRTYYAYLKDYENQGSDFDYEIAPQDLYEELGVGLKIIDEVHEDFHLQLRSNIYSNVEYVLPLSATLETDDPTLKQLYHYSLPKDRWYAGLDYDAYVGVIAAFFRSSSPGQETTSVKGSDNYSHAAYEQYIMESQGRLSRYLTFIDDLVHEYYLVTDYEAGQRCLIFCSLVELCEVVTEYLTKRIPGIVTQTYVGDSEDSVLKTSDIIVSTVGSCGTAVDIAGLRTMLLTRAINRREANEQIKGRGRRLAEWPDVTPILIYFVNKDISKHVQYHRNKLEQYEGKVAFHDQKIYEVAI